jgi:hypothetical protein
VIFSVLKETAVGSVKEYARRVRFLAAIYVLVVFLCLFGEFLLFGKIRFFVTLAQRSNVETLTLAFFVVFYAYLALLCGRGAWGAARMLAGNAAWAKGKREGRKMRMLRRRHTTSSVALNYALSGEGSGHLAIPVQDEFGELGRFECQGARLTYHDFISDGSNDLFAFLVNRVRLLEPEAARDLDIMEWGSLNEEEMAKFLAIADFARNLEQALGKPALWPTVRLTENRLRGLEQELSALCPALRDEAFLPDWEYEGEHKIPIIPEPLGIISFRRGEKRLDPLVSMASALVMVALSVAVLLWISLVPPWVPGA